MDCKKVLFENMNAELTQIRTRAEELEAKPEARGRRARRRAPRKCRAAGARDDGRGPRSDGLLSVEHFAGHFVGAIAMVPRNVVIRAVTLAGLLVPWIWLVAIDRLLNRQR